MRLVTAPNWPTPEPSGGRPPSCMTRRARSCSRSLSSTATTGLLAAGEVGPLADCVLSTALTPTTAATTAATRATAAGRTAIRRRPVTTTE